MKIQDASNLAACLRRARPTLVYFPHRYAAWLLGRSVGGGVPARALKTSRHGRLLENALVRRIASRAADGILTRRALDVVDARGVELYRIDFTTWGPRSRKEWGESWFQTSRPGVNLVLLLNFSPQHDAAYRRCLDPQGAFPMVNQAHPHARAPELTLAWARIDLDLGSDEALIEEIQSDWVRDMSELRWWAGKSEDPGVRDARVRSSFENRTATFDALERYWTRVLAHHRAWWAEATLFAALWLLFERLAVRRVYYHTHEGGLRRKRMGGEPPRSLYTQLPRRFGFELTREGPALLRKPAPRRLRARKTEAAEPPWYRLVL